MDHNRKKLPQGQPEQENKGIFKPAPESFIAHNRNHHPGAYRLRNLDSAQTEP